MNTNRGPNSLVASLAAVATAFTFAVIDVDKTLDLPNDNHGSKIIVMVDAGTVDA